MSKLDRILRDASPTLTWQQRDEYKQRAFNQKRFQRFTGIFLLFGSAALVLMLLPSIGILKRSPALFFITVSFQVAGLIAIAISTWLEQREKSFEVVRLLRQDGIMPGMCPKCSYRLKNCVSERCPECGYEVGQAET